MFDAKARQELAAYFEAHNVPFDPDFSMKKYGLKPMSPQQYRDHIRTCLEETLAPRRPGTNQAIHNVWKWLVGNLSLDGFK